MFPAAFNQDRQSIGARLWGAVLAVLLMAQGCSHRPAIPTGVGEPPELIVQAGHSAAVTALAVSPDGQWLASGAKDNLVKIWEAKSGLLIRTLAGHTHWVLAVAFTRGGDRLVSAGRDGTVIQWDVRAGRRTGEWGGNADLSAAALSPDARWAVTATRNGAIKTFDLDARKEVTVAGETEEWDRAITSLSVSADGRWLATSGADNTVRLWETASGALISTLAGHGSWVLSAAFSPDGRWLATGGADATVRIWNLNQKKWVVSLVGLEGGEWVSATPEGYFDASPQGDRFLSWRVGLDSYPADRYQFQFRRPDRLVEALTQAQP